MQTEHSGITSEDVVRAYRVILGRDPENDDIVARHCHAYASYDQLLTALLRAPETLMRLGGQRPPAYYVFDHFSLLDKFLNNERQHRSGRIVNFMGVSTDLNYVNWAKEEVENLPLTGNFHATTAEWSAVLRAVDLAQDRFTICELGAGWGCWMVNTAVAARRRGIMDIHAIGIEGERHHAAWIAEHAADNGLDLDCIRFEHAVVGPIDGVAAFPDDDAPGVNYGRQPHFFPDQTSLDAFIKKSIDKYQIINSLSLESLIKTENRIDLLHMDIQGGELSIVKMNIEILAKKVAYLFIGTHGREIEGQVIQILTANGFVLEVEEPCSRPQPLLEAVSYIDGAQGWRNTRLLPL